MVGNTRQYLGWARWVLCTGALGLNEIADVLNGGLVHAAGVLLHCKDRMVITDMGKSGHASRKIVATVISIGTPVSFIHPVKAAHGNLDMIANNDVVATISNSEESDETTAVISTLRHKNATLIGITTRLASILVCYTDIHIAAAVFKEVCLLELAPTISTTAVTVPGDTLTAVLLRVHAFTPDDSTLSHPVDSLGRRLLLQVAGIMYSSDALLVAANDTLPKETTVHMSEKGLGMLAVADEAGCLKGMSTDGDPCRLFQQRDNFAGLTVDDVMHTSPKTIAAGKLATEALKYIQADHINGLLVVEADGTLTGMLSMRDLLTARVV